MTSNDLRNRRLKAKLGFDYADMPMPSLPTMTDLHLQQLAAPATPPPPVYPANFAPADPTIHKPAISEGFDIASLTYTDFKALNLNFVQEHELIGRIRDEVPLIDRDEVDSIILADAGKQLKNGIFTLCRMMHISPKAVKQMMDQQFKEFYGPEVDREVSKALTPAVEVRETVENNTAAAETGGSNHTFDDDARDKSASVPRSLPGVELTPAPELSNKKIKLAVQEESLEDVKEFEQHMREETPQVHATPARDARDTTSIRNSVSTARDGGRVSVAASDRSATVRATPMPEVAKKKGKQGPPSKALREIRAYKGQRTRRKEPCCIATLRSEALSRKWIDLQEGGGA